MTFDHIIAFAVSVLAVLGLLNGEDLGLVGLQLLVAALYIDRAKNRARRKLAAQPKQGAGND